MEGHKYVFRVAAENKIGVGPWVELRQAAAAKSQFGENHSTFPLQLRVRLPNSSRSCVEPESYLYLSCEP